MSEEVTLQEYWKMLSLHDWHYQYSDDHSVWRRGHLAQKEVERVSGQSEAHLALHNGWIEWLCGNGEQPEMPEGGQ